MISAAENITNNAFCLYLNDFTQLFGKAPSINCAADVDSNSSTRSFSLQLNRNKTMATEMSSWRDRRKEFYYVDELGEGAHGRTVLALHKRTNELYAFKSSLIDERRTDYDSAKLPYEAEVAQHLRNIPGVCQLVGWSKYQAEDNDQLRFALTCWSFSNADSLLQFMFRSDNQDFLVPGRWACRWLAQAFIAIHEMHARGISHNDIKEDNIVLNQIDSKTEPDVVIIDFGLSRLPPQYWSSDATLKYSDISWAEECLGDYKQLLDYWKMHLTTHLDAEQEKAVDLLITKGLVQVKGLEEKLDAVQGQSAMGKANSAEGFQDESPRSGIAEALVKLEEYMRSLAVEVQCLEQEMPTVLQEQLKMLVEVNTLSDLDRAKIVGFSGSSLNLDLYVPNMHKDRDNVPKCKLIADGDWITALR